MFEGFIHQHGGQLFAGVIVLFLILMLRESERRKR